MRGVRLLAGLVGLAILAAVGLVVARIVDLGRGEEPSAWAAAVLAFGAGAAGARALASLDRAAGLWAAVGILAGFLLVTASPTVQLLGLSAVAGAIAPALAAAVRASAAAGSRGR